MYHFHAMNLRLCATTALDRHRSCLQIARRLSHDSLSTHFKLAGKFRPLAGKFFPSVRF